VSGVCDATVEVFLRVDVIPLEKKLDEDSGMEVIDLWQ
jgi:hypothetical protein